MSPTVRGPGLQPVGGEQGEGVGRDLLIATVTAIREVKLYLMNLQHVFANGEGLERVH